MIKHLYRWLIVTILSIIGFGNSISIYAGVADPPTLSTAESPTYYVIMNVSFGTYLRYEGHDRNRPRLRNLSDMNDASLWYFTSANSSTRAQDGVNFVSKGAVDETETFNVGTLFNPDYQKYKEGVFEGECLSFDKQYANNLAFFEQPEANTIWYVHKSPYDNAGCVISHTAGQPATGTTNCWFFDKDGSNYYIKTGNLENQDYYKYAFYNYQDLLDLAAAIGMNTTSYESADRTSGASFKTLITAINTFKSNTSTPTLTEGSYLLRNRRTGLYMNTNGTALTGVSTPTQYSVWRIKNEGGTWFIVSKDDPVNGTSIRLTTGQEQPWDLDPAHSQAFNPTVAKSSDGDPRYLKLNYQEGNNIYSLSMHTTEHYIYRTTSGGITSDWELIPVTKDANGVMAYTSEGEDYTAYHVVESEDALIPVDDSPANVRYFRIQNMTRSVSAYDEDRFNGGGWLEDVDKMHFTYRKDSEGVTDDVFQNPKAFDWNKQEAMLMYTAKDVPFYAAECDMSHASALWEFVLIGRGSVNDENATGLISPEHNIYALRNANTGMYIKGVSDVLSEDGRSFLKTTDSRNDAVKFYLTKLVDGQWAFNVYGSTNGSGSDVADGCLYIDGQSSGYHGGMNWLSNKVATANSHSAWSIIAAPTLVLPMLVRDLTEDLSDTGRSHEYDWTTFYYPFDVTLSNQNPDEEEIKIYVGEWADVYTYNNGNKGGRIEMTEVPDVPAGNAVFMSSTKNNGESYKKVILDVWAAGSRKTTANLTDFNTNVWKGNIESGDVIDGNPNYIATTWRNYWVLSRNSKGYLRLLHPAADYLLPNRAYLDALTTTAVSGQTNISQFQLLFRTPTEIKGIEENANTYNHKPVIYNIQGQRMNGTLPRGLYIIDGKKVFVK